MISNLRSASSTAIPLCVRQTTVLAEVLIFAVTGICLTMKDAAHVVVSQSEARMADSTAGWKVIGQGANALAASGDADMKRLAEEIRFAAPMPTSIDGEIAAQVFYDSTAITWGDKWKEKIIEGLHSSEFAIIVLSEQFFDREWTERELHELLEQQNENKQKLVLPLLYGITIEQLTKKYPQLGEIQCISAMTYSKEKIAILLAKELIKRYKAIGGKKL